MKKKVLGVSIGFGIFIAGVVSGTQLQKVSHNKKTTYAGVLQVIDRAGVPELYLEMGVSPEVLIDSADVIFKVNKIKGA